MFIELNAVIKFKATIGNPVMQMVDYINKNYEEEKIIQENKLGTRIVQSYKNTLIAHIACGFDSYIIKHNLGKKNIIKKFVTDRGLVKLGFRSGDINTVP